jgi:hypothetical protein
MTPETFLQISTPLHPANVINCAKFRIDRQGVTVGWGPKIACFQRQAESCITQHCTTVNAVMYRAAHAKVHQLYHLRRT